MMEQKKGKNFFLVEDSAQSFESWINKPFISNDLKSQLSNANVLIVPREGYLDKDLPVFPSGTEELFLFLKENENKGVKVNICIEEKEYRELILHGVLIDLGRFIVTDIVKPIIVDLLSEYIKKRRANKVDKAEIKVELIVVKENSSARRFLYEGPAKDFNKVFKQALKAEETSSPKYFNNCNTSKKIPQNDD